MEFKSGASHRKSKAIRPATARAYRDSHSHESAVTGMRRPPTVTAASESGPSESGRPAHWRFDSDLGPQSMILQLE